MINLLLKLQNAGNFRLLILVGGGRPGECRTPRPPTHSEYEFETVTVQTLRLATRQ